MSSSADLDLPARYRIERALGEGGFGTVHLATDAELGCRVAIKVLAARYRGGDVAARFEREGRRTAQLSHPAIVAVHDLGVTPRGAPYIVYEYLEGRTLEDLVLAREAVAEGDVVRWGATIARALGVIHAAGMIHRDVKPANVMVRATGEPVLLDLGIVHATGGETVHTAEGVILGTPGFLAPECWLGAGPTPEVDQYAWAATLYELLYHRQVQPEGGLPVLVDWAGKKIPPAIPRGFAGRLPAVEEALLIALDPDPGARFVDMEAFARSLEREGTEAAPVADPLVATRMAGEEDPDLTEPVGMESVDIRAAGSTGPPKPRETGPPPPPAKAPEAVDRRAPTKAPAGAPDAEAPPGLGWRALAPAGALLVTAFLLLGGGRSAPPPTTRAPEPPTAARPRPPAREELVAAEARSRSALARAVEGLRLFHEPEELRWDSRLRSHGKWILHLRDAFPGANSPDLDEIWNEWATRALAWLEGLRRLVESEGGGPGLDRDRLGAVEELLLGVPAHLLDDYRFREMIITEEPFVIGLGSLRKEGREVRIQAVRTVEQAIRSWPETPPALLAVAAIYRALLNKDATTPVLQELADDLRAHPAREPAFWRERAMAMLLMVDMRARVGRCAPMLALVRAAWPRLRARTEFAEDRRLDLVARYTSEAVRSLLYCPAESGDVDWAILGQCLEVLAEAAPRDPEWVADALKRFRTLVQNAQLISGTEISVEQASADRISAMLDPVEEATGLER